MYSPACGTDFAIPFGHPGLTRAHGLSTGTPALPPTRYTICRRIATVTGHTPGTVSYGVTGPPHNAASLGDSPGQRPQPAHNPAAGSDTVHAPQNRCPRGTTRSCVYRFVIVAAATGRT